MKNLLFIAAMILVAGCSTSQPTHSDSDISGEKAAPAPGAPSTTMYTEPVSKDAPAPTATSTSMNRSCKTPLGNIPDGGSATGYMAATVPTDEVCISDTITCKDGKWSGKAIHPTCKIGKPKPKK
jgi:hypothetical protein